MIGNDVFFDVRPRFCRANLLSPYLTIVIDLYLEWLALDVNYPLPIPPKSNIDAYTQPKRIRKGNLLVMGAPSTV